MVDRRSLWVTLSCSAILLRKAQFENLFAKMRPLKKDTRLVKSLHQKKFRQEYGLFIVEGLKMVEEAMNSSFEPVALYSTDDDWVERTPTAMRITNQEMDMISALSSPSKHLIVLKQKSSKDIQLNGHVLVLDGISDPGNLGTMIRTAEWFGFRYVLCTNDCVELYNPKTVQSTMGSLFRMNVRYDQTPDLVSNLAIQGYELVGAEMNGENVYHMKFAAKTAMVIGSESHGIRPELKEKLNRSLTIPGGGGAESLNASIAAAVIMSELARRS